MLIDTHFESNYRYLPGNPEYDQNTVACCDINFCNVDCYAACDRVEYGTSRNTSVVYVGCITLGACDANDAKNADNPFHTPTCIKLYSTMDAFRYLIGPKTLVTRSSITQDMRSFVLG